MADLGIRRCSIHSAELVDMAFCSNYWSNCFICHELNRHCIAIITEDFSWRAFCYKCNMNAYKPIEPINMPNENEVCHDCSALNNARVRIYAWKHKPIVEYQNLIKKAK